jgi:histidyl-tRNA synthetase
MAVLANDPDAAALTKILPSQKPDVFLALATKDAAAVSKGVGIIEALRRFGIRTNGGLFNLSLKAQMREAGRQDVRFTVVLGEDELKKDPPTCKLKEMDTGTQEDVALSDLLENIGNKLSRNESVLPQSA